MYSFRGNGYLPGSDVYYEMLDILGKMKRLGKLQQLLDEIPLKDGLLNQGTNGTLPSRFSAAHKVEKFRGRKEFGLEFVTKRKILRLWKFYRKYGNKVVSLEWQLTTRSLSTFVR